MPHTLPQNQTPGFDNQRVAKGYFILLPKKAAPPLPALSVAFHLAQNAGSPARNQTTVHPRRGRRVW